MVLLSYPDRECGSGDVDEQDCEATPRVIFHNLEFWATFVFSVTEVIAVRYSPRNEEVLTQYPEVLKFTLGLNVGLALVSASLVAINLERFEVPSHQIEYAHSTLAAAIDVILILSLVRSDDGMLAVKAKEGQRTWAQYAGISFSVLCVVASITQIALYNGLGIDEEGYPAGETPAHYLEFSFDFVSAVILYWFCIDNAFRCDVEQSRILVLEDRDMVKLSVSGITGLAGVGPHESPSERVRLSKEMAASGKL